MAVPARMLLVEDEPNMVRTLAKILERKGYIVDAAGSGAEALDRLSGASYDIVITDLNMPVMDGCEAAGALRRQSADSELVLIAHTSLTQRADLERVRRAGFNHHVSKPAGHRELEALVAKCREARAKS